jgi:hypothetical protein
MYYDPWTRRLAAISTVLLAVLFVMLLFAAGRSPSTSDRLDRIETQLEFQTCILQIEPANRDAAAIAGCISPPVSVAP